MDILGIITQIFRLAWETLYRLSLLPSPHIMKSSTLISESPWLPYWMQGKVEVQMVNSMAYRRLLLCLLMCEDTYNEIKTLRMHKQRIRILVTTMPFINLMVSKSLRHQRLFPAVNSKNISPVLTVPWVVDPVLLWMRRYSLAPNALYSVSKVLQSYWTRRPTGLSIRTSSSHQFLVLLCATLEINGGKNIICLSVLNWKIFSLWGALIKHIFIKNQHKLTC